MARIRKIDEDPPNDWQVVFCSLSIILVAFFVMLCSMASMEEGKMVEVKRSFKGALDIFSGGILFDKGEGIVVPSPDGRGRVAREIAAPIFHMLQGQGLEEMISLKSTAESVSITMLEGLAFEPGSALIGPEGQRVLRELAGLLSDINLPIRIEGHTDDRQVVNEQVDSNWELSAMRAANVMRILVEEGNVPSKLFSAAGFAQYRPFVPNKTDEERRRNRRVEIIIPLVQETFDNRETLKNEPPPSFKVWDLGGV
ncbi:MAG: flagellar motor protein MotB [Deltaproteobacteria bacterium]|nr:flagellar motor protein MotB [Deltaproteobacteria bacterium]